jgi:hypothetical protein
MSRFQALFDLFTDGHGCSGGFFKCNSHLHSLKGQLLMNCGYDVTSSRQLNFLGTEKQALKILVFVEAD